jgi:hypothetical protein
MLKYFLTKSTFAFLEEHNRQENMMADMDQLQQQYTRRDEWHADRGGGRSREDWRVVV